MGEDMTKTKIIHFKKMVTLTLIFVLMNTMFLTASANEQCPETIATPLELLQGTWGFNTAGTGLPFVPGTAKAHRSLGVTPANNVTPAQPVASAGTFTASMGTDPTTGALTGVLTTTTTTSRNGEIVEETGTGSYNVFSDCSGGSLTFNLASGRVS
jgi:hypothetical protein